MIAEPFLWLERILTTETDVEPLSQRHVQPSMNPVGHLWFSLMALRLTRIDDIEPFSYEQNSTRCRHRRRFFCPVAHSSCSTLASEHVPLPDRLLSQGTLLPLRLAPSLLRAHPRRWVCVWGRKASCGV